MKKKMKIILIAAALLLVAAYAVYDYLQPLPVETLTLAPEDGAITFTETGIVLNDGEVSLYPMASGEVEAVKVEKGDRVKPGQVLAELDSDLLAIQRRQLEKTIAAYMAQMKNVDVEYAGTVDNMKATRSNLYSQIKALEAQAPTEEQVAIQTSVVEQAKATWERSLEDLAKYQLLYVEGIIAESALNDLKALAANYESAYNQSLMQLSSLESGTAGGDYLAAMKNGIWAQISAIDKSLARDNTSYSKAYFQAMADAARAQLDALDAQIAQYTITAPVAGVVDEVHIGKSNVAAAGMPAFVIQGEGSKEVEVLVNTRDISEVETGDRVMLVLDQRSGDVEIEGEVVLVSDKATERVSPLGVIERRVAVRVRPINGDALETGYSMDVRFTVYSASDRIIVPNSALYRVDGEDRVLAIQGGKAVELAVELGYELTGKTIVESGLAPGDVLIVDLDAKGLKAGARVAGSGE